MGHFRTHPADLPGCPPGAAGLALSRPASLERKGWIKPHWGVSDNNRRAKYYELTRAGEKQLKADEADWRKLAAAVGLLLDQA